MAHATKEQLQKVHDEGQRTAAEGNRNDQPIKGEASAVEVRAAAVRRSKIEASAEMIEVWRSKLAQYRGVARAARKHW